MLNIKFNLSAEVRHIEYPIRFKGKNICVHCGAEGYLEFVDAFGNKTKHEIHPFDHIICLNCGKRFSIQWDPDDLDPKKMVPSAVAPSIKQEFVNLFNKSGKSYDI